MPFYKLTAHNENEEYEAFFIAADETEAINRWKLVPRDDSSDEVPISAKEVDITLTFQLVDKRSYEKVVDIAQRHGLSASKTTGAYRLEVSGRGKVIEGFASNRKLYRAQNKIRIILSGVNEFNC